MNVTSQAGTAQLPCVVDERPIELLTSSGDRWGKWRGAEAPDERFELGAIPRAGRRVDERIRSVSGWRVRNPRGGASKDVEGASTGFASHNDDLFAAVRRRAAMHTSRFHDRQNHDMSTVPFDASSAPMAGAADPHRSVLRRIVHSRIAKATVTWLRAVETVLNVINDAEPYRDHHAVGFWHIAMNFVVPYCVSSYSTARSEARRGRGN